MITIRQYQILNACADGPVLFYHPFAMVNFGGQLFRLEDGPGYAQYDDGTKRITISGKEIADDIMELALADMLQCWQIKSGLRDDLICPDRSAFKDYDGYQCRTFMDHINRFGYGPQDFE